MEDFDLSLFLTYISIAIPFNFTSAITVNSFYLSTFKNTILPHVSSDPQFTFKKEIDKLHARLDSKRTYLDNLIEKLPFSKNTKLSNQLDILKDEINALEARYRTISDITYIYNKLQPKYVSMMFYTSFIFCMLFMILTILKSYSSIFSISMLIYITTISLLYFFLLVLDDCFGEAIRSELKHQLKLIKSKKIAYIADKIDTTLPDNFYIPIALYLLGLCYIYEYNINLENITDKLQLAISIILLPYLGHIYYFIKITNTIVHRDMFFLTKYLSFQIKFTIVRLLIRLRYRNI